MCVSDPIGDMLTKIRNANCAGIENVLISGSKIKLEIAKILKSEGYIKNFHNLKSGKFPSIQLQLKYDSSRHPVIHGIERVSKPGRRVYFGFNKIPDVLNGYGVLIISTSLGLMVGRRAIKQKAGGEIICKVW